MLFQTPTKMYLKSLVRVASVGALYRHKQEDSPGPEPGPSSQTESPRTAAAAQSRQTVTQLPSSYHHHQQSPVSRVLAEQCDYGADTVSHAPEPEGGAGDSEQLVLDLLAETVTKPNELSKQQAQAEKLKSAITKARNLVWCKMYESGAPGMVRMVVKNIFVTFQKYLSRKGGCRGSERQDGVAARVRLL